MPEDPSATLSRKRPQERQSNVRYYPKDFVPSNNHIMCGRGKGCAKHEGNKRFSEFIRATVQRYTGAKKRAEKSVVVTSLVDTILDSGRRFVKYDSSKKLWYDIGEDGARNKCGHAIRDLLTSGKNILMTKKRKMENGTSDQNRARLDAKEDISFQNPYVDTMKNHFQTELRTISSPAKLTDNFVSPRNPPLISDDKNIIRNATFGMSKQENDFFSSPEQLQNDELKDEQMQYGESHPDSNLASQAPMAAPKNTQIWTFRDDNLYHQKVANPSFGQHDGKCSSETLSCVSIVTTHRAHASTSASSTTNRMHSARRYGQHMRGALLESPKNRTTDDHKDSSFSLPSSQHVDLASRGGSDCNFLDYEFFGGNRVNTKIAPSFSSTMFSNLYSQGSISVFDPTPKETTEIESQHNSRAAYFMREENSEEAGATKNSATKEIVVSMSIGDDDQMWSPENESSLLPWDWR